MKKLKKHVILIAIVSLYGCISAAVEGRHLAVEEISRSHNQKAAEKGDRVAQYNLGESFCCSTDKTGSACDTTIAVHWLCASAKQGYSQAMYKLGKIYSGDVIDGLRLPRRATTGVTEAINGSTVSMPAGFAWLKLAALYGNQEAPEKLASVRKSMTVSDISKGESLVSQGLSIPCEMKEVL